MIDTRESQILERTGAKRVKQTLAGGRRVELSARYLIEQILQLFV